MDPKKKSWQIQVELSQARTDLHAAGDDAEKRDAAIAKIAALEPEYRSALADEAAEAALSDAEADPETRERRELVARVSVGRFLVAGMAGSRLDGAEEELRQAVDAGERTIPYEAFGNPVVEVRENREVTGQPGTVGLNPTTVVPAVFARSMAMYLGITMPRVASGTYAVPRIATGLEAAFVAPGADAPERAATFEVDTTTPHRVSAALGLRAEDLASVGIPAFEASLRQNLTMVLSDVLDGQLVVGDGEGNNIHGLLSRIGNADAADALLNFASAAAQQAAFVEGRFAHMLSDLRALHNPAVYAFLAALFATNDDSVAALEWSMRQGIGHRNSANMPASSAAHVGTSLVVRGGAATGAMGPLAVSPVWGGIAITDPYSDAGSATHHVYLHMLVGDVTVRYPGAYSEWSIKTA